MIKEVFSPKFAEKTPNGEFNFVGVVKAYFHEFKNNCDESTKNQYIRDYNERIFPIVSPSVPIAEYTVERIEEYINQLQKLHNYDDTTMHSRYNHLFADPVKFYFNLVGFSKDILWGAGFRFQETKDETKEEKLLRIRKSLTIQEELSVAEYLLSDPETDDGVKVGLAVMFLAAARNSEACGINYGDLIEFQMYPGRYYLRLYETTKADRNVLKLGGKTSNAPRLIPIPKVLSDFLLNRKAYLQTKISFPYTDENGKVYETIETLPVACRKNRYSTRCSRKDLTDAGRNLLQYQLKMDEEQVSGINVIIQDDIDELGEKDPTSYLFRRNLATHLRALGFSQLQIQYYMGHKLENAELERSDFVNEKILYQMSLLLEEHPLNASCSSGLVRKTLNERIQWENVVSAEVTIEPQQKKKVYCLKLENRELNDPIATQISGDGFEVRVMEMAGLAKRESEINITKQVHYAYKVLKKND